VSAANGRETKRAEISSHAKPQSRKGKQNYVPWYETLQSVYNPKDPILDQVLAKIDQQPQSGVRQTQIGQQLLFMYRCNLFDLLELHDQDAVDYQICPEALIEADTVVDHYLYLTQSRKSRQESQSHPTRLISFASLRLASGRLLLVSERSERA
jgi:hypothetical protein